MINLNFSENSECDIIQNLPDEREEDFRVRRFTEKFTKLNIPSQHSVVSQLFGLSSHTPPQVEEQDKRKAGKNFFFAEMAKIGKRGGGGGCGGGYGEEEFIKVKRPDLRGGGETVTTQGGAGSR